MTGLKQIAVKFVVFALVSLVLFFGLYRMMSNTVSGDQNEWTARFVAVSGLRQGDDVRVAGVRVGRVEKIAVADDTTGDGIPEALVTFSLQADQEVYEGTVLSMRYQNLVGQRYLAMDVLDQRGKTLKPDDEISVERTDSGFDLTALLNGFEPLFAVLEPSEVNKLATNIVAVLQGEAGTVESLLEHTAQATSFLADREELFDEVVTNLTPALQNLDAQSDDFDKTIVQFRKLMTGLAAEKDTFGNSIDHLGSLLDSTSALLTELRQPLKRDVRALRQTTALVLREQQRVIKLVGDLTPGLGAIARSMSYGAWMNVYVCNLGITLEGQATWLGGSGGPYSEVCR